MKLVHVLLLAAALCLPALGACSNDESPKPAATEDGQTQSLPAQSGVDKNQLLHHHFVLKKAGGAEVGDKEPVPSLEFNEGLRLSGGICNRFTGQAEIKDGVLTAKQMAFTRMMCADEELNTLENRFADMLEKGASISYDGKTLVLSHEGYVLEYELSDRMQ